MSHNRYTAEFRGGDVCNEGWEWYVVDKSRGLSGHSILFDLTEEEAIAKAKELNGDE